MLRGATLVLFVAALARPQLGRSESKIKTEGIDIVLVVDISGSMQAMDYEKMGQRESRIDAVKDVVREFIRSRPNDRIGMVVFGTRAYVASPLTLDHDWLERNLDRVRIGLVEGNTAIGAGIGTAVNRLRDTKAKSKVIVLLTDGGENVQQPAGAGSRQGGEGIQRARVHRRRRLAGDSRPCRSTIGDGNLLGYQPIQADLDEDLLKQIADADGRTVFPRGGHGVAEEDLCADRRDGKAEGRDAGVRRVAGIVPVVSGAGTGLFAAGGDAGTYATAEVAVMQFGNPTFFWLLALVPVLAVFLVWAFRARRRALERFAARSRWFSGWRSRSVPWRDAGRPCSSSRR